MLTFLYTLYFYLNDAITAGLSGWSGLGRTNVLLTFRIDVLSQRHIPFSVKLISRYILRNFLDKTITVFPHVFIEHRNWGLREIYLLIQILGVQYGAMHWSKKLNEHIFSSMTCNTIPPNVYYNLYSGTCDTEIMKITH